MITGTGSFAGRSGVNGLFGSIVGYGSFAGFSGENGLFGSNGVTGVSFGLKGVTLGASGSFAGFSGVDGFAGGFSFGARFGAAPPVIVANKSPAILIPKSSRNLKPGISNPPVSPTLGFAPPFSYKNSSVRTRLLY